MNDNLTEPTKAYLYEENQLLKLEIKCLEIEIKSLKRNIEILQEARAEQSREYKRLLSITTSPTD